MTDTTEPMGSRSPKRAIVITLAVLGLAWLAFPAPVASWLADSCYEQPYCPALQAAADAVDAASHGIGVAGTLEAARDELRAALGIDFY